MSNSILYIYEAMIVLSPHDSGETKQMNDKSEGIIYTRNRNKKIEVIDLFQTKNYYPNITLKTRSRFIFVDFESFFLLIANHIKMVS